ncbi:MAG: ATP-binding protein [Thermosediminibacteraceae bacterium]|nr:ATP-binding protein [Thermosediminibacteraceae bacterium]
MYYDLVKSNFTIIKDPTVFEDLFTQRSYKILDDPAVFVKEGSHIVVVENEAEKENSAGYTFTINTTIVTNKDGIAGIIIYCEDKGKSEKVQKDPSNRKSSLEENLAVIGELAASAVHEIKNPLFSIRGFLQIIDNTFAEDDKRKEYVRIMISEIDRLEGLVRDFLMLARTRPDSKEQVAVCELIREVAELYKSSFEKKKVKFRLQAQDESVSVCGNWEQLEQVFINLIQNALEAMEEGGSLDIVVSKTEEKVIIEVRDNGKGISPDAEKKIFSPFFTTKKNGTGLGLFLSKKIIEDHNGKIYFSSAEGKGTAFFLEFPIQGTPVDV